MSGRYLLLLLAFFLNGCGSLVTRLEPGRTVVYPGLLSWSRASINGIARHCWATIDFVLCLAFDTLLLPLDITLILLG